MQTTTASATAHRHMPFLREDGAIENSVFLFDNPVAAWGYAGWASRVNSGGKNVPTDQTVPVNDLDKMSRIEGLVFAFSGGSEG